MIPLFRFGALSRRLFGTRQAARHRSRGPDAFERRRLGHICRLESLEPRELLAWNATFGGGFLAIQHTGTATTGVLKADASGALLLDRTNSGTFINTGATLATLTGPIQVNAGTTADTRFIVDNNSGNFLNVTSFTPSAGTPTIVYNGGSGTFGSELVVLGRANFDDRFTVINPVATVGDPLLDPPIPDTTAATLRISNTPLGNFFLNYTNLNGNLELDGLTGNDELTVNGISTLTLDATTMKLQPFIRLPGDPPPGTQRSGGDIVYSAFESLAINGLGGGDFITVNGLSIPDTLIDGGADDDIITINAPLPLPLTVDGGGGSNRLIVNGTSADDDFFMDKNTVSGVGATISYQVGSFEFAELHGLAGDDNFTIQVAPRFQPPFVTESLPVEIRVFGDDAGTLTNNHLRVLGNNPIPNLTLGNDDIVVGDFGNGDPIEMVRIDSLVIYGLAGNDTLRNSSTGNIGLGIPPVPSMLIGGDGDDILTGGLGDDILIGGDGEEEMNADEGDDYLFPDFDESGQIFNIPDEVLSAGDGDDTVVRGIIDALASAQLGGVPIDADEVTGTSDSLLERVIDIVDPRNPTSHLFRVTPALLALEEAFRTPLAVREFGPLRNLRKQFATVEAFIGRAYDDFLVGLQGRTGVTLPEINFWANLNSQGLLTIEQIQAQLLASDEYRQTHRLTIGWVRAIFADVLGRAPNNAELTRFATPVMGNDTGAARFAAALDFLTSGDLSPTNPVTAQIRSMYQEFFPSGRQPTSTDETAIRADLAAGFPLHEIALAVFDSGGDYLPHVVANNIGQVGFVGALYRDVLNRTGSIGEVTFWTNEIARGVQSRAGIANFFLNSTEKRAMVVDDYYRTFLGRPADPGGLSFWLGALASGARRENVVAGILSSPEYFLRQGGTSDTFVRALYRDLLRRPTSPGQLEVDFWIAQLAISTRGAIPARADVVLAFQASDEFRGLLIDDYFQIFLGRDPSPAELDILLNTFRAGATQEAIQLELLLTR